MNGPIAQFWLERTPDKREVDGSSPSRPTTRIGGLAQLGERLPCTQEVIGSIPVSSTKRMRLTSGICSLKNQINREEKLGTRLIKKYIEAIKHLTYL